MGAGVVLGAIMLGGLIVGGSDRASASYASIEVSVAVEEPAFWPDLARFDVTVRNVGDEPLTSVGVRGTEPANADFTNSVGAPTVVSGNTDAVFDPGEVWTIAALGQHIHGYVEVIATATTPWGATVSATDRLTYTFVIKEPLIASIRPAADHVAVAGDPMDWTIEVTNVSASSLALTPYDPPGLATSSASGDTDSDGLIDPGELWRWMLTTPVAQDCTTLTARFTMRGAASNLYGLDATSSPVRIGSPTDACPVAPTVEQYPPSTSHVSSGGLAISPATTSTTGSTLVGLVLSPATTSTTDPTLVAEIRLLPATGRPGTGSGWFGACALIAGALMVMLSRRRGQTVPE